jgi:hypothetical protein
MESFDIVVPLGPKDIDKIHIQIEHTKKNIIGYRNIYLVSAISSINIQDCIVVSEDIFPFSIETVAQYHGKHHRNGWYLQQLIKLYAGIFIPNILDRYLVIDADTIFLKPTKFLVDNKCLYSYGSEYHLPYFEHLQKLHPSFTKIDKNKSGICHHMILETKYIQEIFNLVESHHHDSFYKVFLKYVTITWHSGASEYELYFNYILSNHLNDIIIRKLSFINTSEILLNSNYDYISCHNYLRNR